jgi:lipid-A-disaccharide synthase
VPNQNRLYFVAGETSGDARGAELMRALHALRPDLEFHGAGGPEMRSLAGERFVDWADEAVVGLWDVLRKYPYFKARFNETLAEISQLQPVAIVLIDYPGFNLRLAKELRRTVPGLKIIYYISPQVWAWNRRRIPQMARALDLMLCIFPFETEFYKRSGLKAVFVGHPFVETLAAKRAACQRVDALVGLFPGSREKEVRRIFPAMLQATREIEKRDRTLHFEAAAASESVGNIMKECLRASGVAEESCPISVGTAHLLMQRAVAGMVASGTATLEAAFFGMPLVILYKVAWLTWVVGKRLVKVDFLGMPNILAGRAIAREFLQNAMEPEEIAARSCGSFTNPRRGNLCNASSPPRLRNSVLPARRSVPRKRSSQKSGLVK